MWERLLLLQFHDILPGSAIAWVHAEARDDFGRLVGQLEALVAEGIETLGGGLLNAGPFARREVIGTGAGLRLVAVPALSVAAGDVVEPVNPVTLEGLTLDNGLVRVVVGRDGSIESLRDLRHGVDGPEVLPEGARAAELRLHPDVPEKWDAWDIDQPHSRTWASPADVTVEVVEVGPLRSVIGGSSVVQRTGLTADSPRVDVEVRVV